MVPAAERTNVPPAGPVAPLVRSAVIEQGQWHRLYLYVFNARVTGGVHVAGGRLGGDRAGTAGIRWGRARASWIT